MNYSMILRTLGWILNAEAALLVLPLATGVIYREAETVYILITMVLCLAIGFPLTKVRLKNEIFYTRESMVITALGWILLSFMGAVPFVISGWIKNPFDAYFEVVSGFTTTGASILTSVEVLPKCLLMWRSFTHWIGGMGVLVFILSVLPLTGGSRMNLMKAESPGPSVSRLVPKVQTTASLLYRIYLGLTVTLILLLLVTGMPLFHALTISFGTAGTGGFGVLNSSCGEYSALQQVIIGIFMLLFGVNFNVYFLLLMKNFKGASESSEPRTYLGIVAFSVVFITANTVRLTGSVFTSLREAFFTVASIMTTSGFAVNDFNLWPTASKTVLVILMLIGACAGSTGGGFKVSRVMLLFKMIRRDLTLYLHPRAVTPIKMDGKTVETDVLRSLSAFTAAYAVITVVSAFLVSLDGFDPVTTLTSVIATFNNIGPGLEVVGPTGNYSLFSNFSKVVLSFDMLAGRLEVFPLLILLYPETWKKFS